MPCGRPFHDRPPPLLTDQTVSDGTAEVVCGAIGGLSFKATYQQSTFFKENRPKEPEKDPWTTAFKAINDVYLELMAKVVTTEEAKAAVKAHCRTNGANTFGSAMEVANDNTITLANMEAELEKRAVPLVTAGLLSRFFG